MNEEIRRQKNFWDAEQEAFDSIYSRKKSGFQNFLDSVFRKDMYERYEFTMKHSEPIKGRSFLDVGCGTARYSVEYAKRGAARVVGLDISDSMIDASKKHAAGNGVADICEFLKVELFQYKPEKKFDVTIGIGLFDYVSEPLPLIKSMAALTSDRVILSFPRLFTWRAPVRKIRLGLRKCDVYFFTRKQIHNLMKDAGFARVEIEKVGKLFCVVGHVGKA